MDKSEVLQRIHWNDDAEEVEEMYNYSELKDGVTSKFKQFLNEGCTIHQCVNGTFYYHYDDIMEDNGMEKLACMVLGLLFEIEHNDVDTDQAYGTAWDIRDFETGNYDDLFTKEDLSEIKADVAKAKEYLLQHKELLEDIQLNN